MGVKISQSSGGGGLSSSPLMKGVSAYMSMGGSLAGGGGAAPAADSGLKKPELGDSIYNKPQAAPPQTAEEFKMPEIGSSMQNDNAISRRQSALSLSPQMQSASIDQGLQALNDPSIPPEMRSAYAEPLLRAKYYGGRRV